MAFTDLFTPPIPQIVKHANYTGGSGDNAFLPPQYLFDSLSTTTPVLGKPKIAFMQAPGGAPSFQIFDPSSNSPITPLLPGGQSQADAWIMQNWSRPSTSGPLNIPTIPRVSGPAFDPNLAVSSLLAPIDEAIRKSQGLIDEAGRPIGDVARGMIDPLIPGLKADINDFISQQVAANQSDAMRRGLTGSSTESLGSADIRGQGAKALEQGIRQLLFQALPVAQEEKRTKIGALTTQMGTLMEKAKTSTSIRGMVSDEQFKTMDLNQRAALFEADATLKMELERIDQGFKEKLLMLEQQFTREQNAQDRVLAQQQMDMLQGERSKARQNAMIKGILTGIGAAAGGVAGGAAGGIGAYPGMVAGGAAGGAAADIFGFVM